MTDTIAAIATARGAAALAIVRVSGPEAVGVASRCFRGADLGAVPSHTAHVGYVTGAGEEGSETASAGDLDQVVATVFRAPRSATGEDVVELSCHGGDVASRLVLERLLEAGARMARPGEFTQRAFLNGKLDLAQAEAVADLIHAGSARAHRASLQHLKGRYSERLEALRAELLELCGLVELEIDFSDEDVEFADRDRLVGLLERTDALLAALLDSYATGAMLRDGVRVVIGGRPNAGKSTLLNALVGHDRAITSPTPGTTRDAIEAEAEIEGLRWRFVDTAGLRATADAIEAEGVRRAEDAIDAADVLLYVVDLAAGLDDAEVAFLQRFAPEEKAPGEVGGVHVVVVGNKADLVASTGDGAAPDLGARVPASLPVVTLSAAEARRDDAALAPLLDALRALVAEHLSRADASPVVMNQRHRQHLAAARAAVRRARSAMDAGVSGDLLALDLRAALRELGHITGAVTNEDVLDQIFARFCIGK
jgi:tRNA modification GTPase